jgi:hypothetical protein
VAGWWPAGAGGRECISLEHRAVAEEGPNNAFVLCQGVFGSGTKCCETLPSPLSGRMLDPPDPSRPGAGQEPARSESAVSPAGYANVPQQAHSSFTKGPKVHGEVESEF